MRSQKVYAYVTGASVATIMPDAVRGGKRKVKSDKGKVSVGSENLYACTSHEEHPLEEKTDVGGWNWGSWNLEKQGPRWWDPIVVRHGRLSVLAYSNGHALQHQWKQKSTLAMTDASYPDAIRWPVNDGMDDLEFMREGFNPAR